MKIIIGDALGQLKELQDESVHCCITSPPYWGLRSYKGDPGMIGLEPTFDEHLENLVAVFREVRRVLRSDGTCWVNYGDAYTKAQGVYPDGSPRLPKVPTMTYKEAGERGNPKEPSSWSTRHQKGMRPTRDNKQRWKPKDLMMMPALVAIALRQPFLKCRGCNNVAHEMKWGRFPNGRKICPVCVKSKGFDTETPGWWIRSEIIWHKPNPMPESVTDRPTSAHEKLFLLSKSARYFYDAEAVSESATCDRTRGPALHPDPVSTNGNAGLSRRDSGGARNLRNVWKISTHSFSEAHFATFPPKLVEPCIKAGTSEKGVCGECGAPWARVVERKVGYSKECPKTKSGHEARGGVGVPVGTVGKSGSGRTDPVITTVGWQPATANATPKLSRLHASILSPAAARLAW